MKILAVRSEIGNCLIPLAEFEDSIATLDHQLTYSIEIKKERNPAFLNKYMSLLRACFKIYDNKKNINFEEFRCWVEFIIGGYELFDDVEVERDVFDSAGFNSYVKNNTNLTNVDLKNAIDKFYKRESSIVTLAKVRSINFSSMTEDEFEEIYNKSLVKLSEIINLSVEDILKWV